MAPEVLDALSVLIRRGREVAARIREVFASGEQARTELLNPLHAQLSRIGESLFAACETGGLFGSYIRMEMMDMDYLPYPDLAGELERKYRALEEWMSRAKASLESL
jgi:hypothetical protein